MLISVFFFIINPMNPKEPLSSRWFRTPPSHGGNSGSNPDNGTDFGIIMKKRKVFLFWFLIIFFLGAASWLFYSVYLKTFPDFPIILRKNDFGLNALVERTFFPYLLLIVFVFTAINLGLLFFFQKKKFFQFADLRFFIYFLNFFFSFLIFILSLQVYFLNI